MNTQGHAHQHQLDHCGSLENLKQSFSFDTKVLKFPWDKITVFRVNKNTELRVLCDTWSGGGKCCFSKQYVNELEHCSDMYS